MSSSRPQPLQSLTFSSGAGLEPGYGLALSSAKASNHSGCGGREKTVVDGLNGDGPAPLILRIETRTEIQCAPANLDAGRKGEGTIFAVIRGLPPAAIRGDDGRPYKFLCRLARIQHRSGERCSTKVTIVDRPNMRRTVKKTWRWYVRDASVSYSTEPAIPVGCSST
jgi:hypothetical protein